MEERLFPLEPRALAQRLARIQAGEVTDEEREVSAGRQVEVSEPRLLGLTRATLRPEAIGALPAPESRGFTAEVYRAAVTELARDGVRQALAGADAHIVQAVNAIDNLSETANSIAERLREWYALHSPELTEHLESHEELAALVSKHVVRDGIFAAETRLVPLARDTLGAELGPEERDALQAFARLLSHTYETRARLERYLETAVPRVAPNLAALAGASLAARLIHKAGGIQDLARMSAGTVQTLGAEKALFRHLREGKPGPKHGAIFVHPLVHRAPPGQRGSVARALANKLAIAARADAISGQTIADALQRALEKRITGIRARGRGKARRGQR